MCELRDRLGSNIERKKKVEYLYNKTVGEQNWVVKIMPDK